MKIRNVAHRALRRFIQRNDASGLPPPVVEKVRNILTFLQEMEDTQELRDVPSWKALRSPAAAREHRASLSPETGGFTFRIDQTEGEILDLDYEDYH